MSRQLPHTEALEIAVARDFRGGLNTYDTDLNLKYSYAVTLRNLYPDTNGRLRLRFGTSLFANCFPYIDQAVNMTYYNGSLVIVGQNGQIVSINSTGTITLRWSMSIAAALPSHPLGWATGVVFASFAQFAGSLVICNGRDKPIVLNELFAASYLQDPGTGSNVNVPRAKYCCTFNGYLVLAGDVTDPSTLYVGMRGTLGTFYGDATDGDNDGTNFAMESYIQSGSPNIIGVAAFRDKLVVLFAEATAFVVLGEYNSSNKHIPRIDDVIASYGVCSNNACISVGDDMFALDRAGCTSVARSILNNGVTPSRESELIATELQQRLNALSDTVLEEHVFAVHDRTSNQILFFIPQDTPVSDNTENYVYVFCVNKSQKFRAWTYYDGMPYRCGCRTIDNRIFLASGPYVWFYHNLSEPLYMDKAVSGVQTWTDGTVWTDLTGFSDPGELTGTPITFEWTMPWTDLRKPGRIKESRYIGFDTEGEGEFTVTMRQDRMTAPDLTMTFFATDTPTNTALGFRPTNNSQLYAWGGRFERAKFKFTGTASNYLAFVSVKLHHLVGKGRR